MNRLERIANTLTNHFWGMTAPKHHTFEHLSRTHGDQFAQFKEQVKIVAHRGVHGEDTMLDEQYGQRSSYIDGVLHARRCVLPIENSMESFDLAAKNNIWGIEFDVRFTKNNIPVVHHDPHCRRLYSLDHIIADTEFEKLREVLPQIPTLREVAQKFGGKTHLLVEIKEPLDDKKVRALAEALDPLKPQQHYSLLSLKPDFLTPVTFAPSSSFMAVDWLDMENTVRKTIDLKYGAVSGHFMLLNDQRLQKCKAEGLITGTGFVETKAAFIREISRGIDWIFTNHPLRLKGFLR